MSTEQIGQQLPTANAGSLSKRLLFFSHEDWDDVWRRNQFICAELTQRHPDLSILWVCRPIDVPYSLARRKMDEIKSIKLAPHTVPEFPGIKVIKPIKLLPNRMGKSFNSWLISYNVRKILQALNWDDFAVWINFEQVIHCFPLPGASKLIYDITDDWTQQEQLEHHRQALLDDTEALLQRADHVIVCSPRLYEGKVGKCRGALSLISNGVDHQKYHPDALANLSAPPDVGAIKKPVVGYIGTLHSTRLDLPLIAAAAELLPQVSFVFIGPNCLTGDELQLLNKHNIHFLGARKYSQLPSYMSWFDCCMTPHLVNNFTDSLDPLKLYEYMSTGKPIVSTPCSGFRQLHELISVAGTPAEFAAAIEREVKVADPARAEQRVKWASQHSWAKRIDQIERLLGWAPSPAAGK
jgi:glycosyltransferase involved in cell wall biosynthesis